MTLRVGWYVHHHGRGHLTRMLAIAPFLDAEITCFSSLPPPDDLPPHCTWTLLDRDDDTAPGQPDPSTADPTVGGLLHWAPLGHAGHRGRLATIAAALADRRFDAFVVDVSVEVTLLVRLLGVPPIVIAQPGRRDDTPHELGYRAAETIIAPWPAALLRPAHLEPVQAKTVFTGGISRFQGRTDAARAATASTDDGGVVLLGGAGGTAVTSDDIAAAAAASGRRWRVLGAAPRVTPSDALAAPGSAAAHVADWSADPWDDLISAHVVVSWAGQNAIADLAAAGAAAVVVPQERPFAEQVETARALDRAGLAVVEPRWPSTEAWPELIARASALRADWSRWEVAGAAERAAAAIEATGRTR